MVKTDSCPPKSRQQRLDNFVVPLEKRIIYFLFHLTKIKHLKMDYASHYLTFDGQAK